MNKANKTNALRILDARGVAYKLLTVPMVEEGVRPAPLNAREVAERLERSPDVTFKTLVTEGKSKEHYVFVVPGSAELDLRKAARAVGEKSINMIPGKELLPLTGYVHGGCSPVGMKKTFATVIDQSAERHDAIVISAGRIGFHMEIALAELRKVLAFTLADVATGSSPSGLDGSAGTSETPKERLGDFAGG